MDMRNERGFTLIELLIVVGIIGLLGALLFPVAAQSVRKANIGKSTGNLRQLGALTAVYTADNNGRLPVYDFTNPDYSWVMALYKLAYGKDFPGFIPQDTGINLKGTILYSPLMQAPEGTPQRSYAINQYLRNGSTQDNRITVMQVAIPSKTLLFSDTKNSSAVGTPQSITYRNDGKSILCFVDGHLETRKESEIPALNSTEGTTFWYHQ